MGIFSDSQGQLTQTCPRFQACPCYLQVLNIKQPRKSDDTVFHIITLWELSVAMETRVLIESGPKLNAAFPPPNDASDKI